MSFLEMPNGFSEEDEDLPAEPRPQEGKLTALRVRDIKTGKFVAGASLVTKGWAAGLEAGSWSIPLGWLGIEKKKERKRKPKSLDPSLSVTLKKKER